jgi:Metal binding domain of Ada
MFPLGGCAYKTDAADPPARGRVRMRPVSRPRDRYISPCEALRGRRDDRDLLPAGCGARPNQENVVRFGLAAAAEAAGFRACLRCRPYRVADLVLWTGPELVCGGVSFLLDRVLQRLASSPTAVLRGVARAFAC